MKIIFVSPFNLLWSDQLSELASRLCLEVVSVGDLLRSESKKGSALGDDVKEILENGDILNSELASKLVVKESGENTILTGFPINQSQAEALSNEIAVQNLSFDAVVVVEISKVQLVEKFEANSYDLKNDKVAYLVDSFYQEKTGILAVSRFLAKEIGAKYIPFQSVKNTKVLLDGNV